MKMKVGLVALMAVVGFGLVGCGSNAPDDPNLYLASVNRCEMQRSSMFGPEQKVCADRSMYHRTQERCDRYIEALDTEGTSTCTVVPKSEIDFSSVR